MVFGTYRTLLALAVLLHHLAGIWELGRYAVFGFFILSGFLMNLILHESYGYSVSGVGKYALNRFLRIFPSYWVTALVTLLIAVVFSSDLERFHELMRAPDSLGNAMSNFFLVVLRKTDPRLVPQSWALTVELFWYCLIGLGVSKTKRLTWIWFLLSLVYVLIVNVNGFGWSWKYFNVLAASLPFATGALIFHYRSEFRGCLSKVGAVRLAVLFFVLACLNYLIFRHSIHISIYKRELCFYSNYILQALIVACLASADLGVSRSRKWDKAVGDLSFPFYLIHYTVAFPVFLVLGEEYSRGNMRLFLVSILPILVLSLLVVRFVDHPIERLRRRVKSRLEVERKGQLDPAVVREGPGE